MTKKVVSIALFGEGEKAANYRRYLPAFVRAHLHLFPREDGWVLRVHHDDKFFSSRHDDRQSLFLHKLQQANLVEAVDMGPAILTKAMLWRMAPVFDSTVDYVFCRDIDACPMPRDRTCCDQFMHSGCVLHTVHDNVMHIGIMGGLCGFDAKKFRELWTLDPTMDALYKVAAQSDEQWAQHGTDQNVLNRLLLRPGGPRLLEHAYAGWERGEPRMKPFREPGRYVCPSLSWPIPDAPTPSSSVWWRLIDRRQDQLANHMGAAGFDHNAAVRFYDENGDRALIAAIRACEA